MVNSAISVLQRARQAGIRREHFPYIVVENALPASYYQALVETFPPIEIVAGSVELKNNWPYRYRAVEVLTGPENPKIWQDFVAYHCSHEFFREVLDFWGGDIARAFPGVDVGFGKPLHKLTTGIRPLGTADNPQTLTCDICLDCQIVINSPVRQVSVVRGIHVDMPEKFYAALLYFRDPDDDAGGDLKLYRFRSPRQVEKFDVVRYAPNTLIMWINTPLSAHAVTPRQITETPRRYVNFLAESYILPAGGFHRYYRYPVHLSKLKKFHHSKYRTRLRNPGARNGAAVSTKPLAR